MKLYASFIPQWGSWSPPWPWARRTVGSAGHLFQLRRSLLTSPDLLQKQERQRNQTLIETKIKYILSWKFFHVYSLCHSVEERSNRASCATWCWKATSQSLESTLFLRLGPNVAVLLGSSVCMPRNHPYTHWHAHLWNEWAWAIKPGA